MARRPPPPQYEAVTDGIRVRVRPKFMHDESEPAKNRYFWSYTVEVINESDTTWTLMRRFWRIVDAKGREQIVEGEGVVGQTPTLTPSERFGYTSGTPLAAPSGFMSGAYFLVNDTGTELKIAVPAFSLDSPYDTSKPS